MNAESLLFFVGIGWGLGGGLAGGAHGGVAFAVLEFEESILAALAEKHGINVFFHKLLPLLSSCCDLGVIFKLC